MKIRTKEYANKFEVWEYELDALPENFEDYDYDEQYDWLQRNCDSANMIHSEYIDLGKIDEYEIVG